MAKRRFRQFAEITTIVLSSCFLVIVFQNCGPGFKTNDSYVQSYSPLSSTNTSSQNFDDSVGGDGAGNLDDDVVIDEPPQMDPDVVVNGPQLYNMYCASCHGNVNSSTKSGRSASRIANAIAIVPGMADLYFLSDEEIQAIADAIR